MLSLTTAETVSQQGNDSLFVNTEKNVSGACVVEPDLHHNKHVPALSWYLRKRESGAGTTTKFTQVNILILYFFLWESLISVLVHA